MPPTPYACYLKTLRRIPKPIRLAMATRVFDMDDDEVCLCGWAVREALAYANGKAAEEYSVHEGAAMWTSSERQAVALFGGTVQEWQAIYFGVVELDLPIIERAFVTAVVEATR